MSRLLFVSPCHPLPADRGQHIRIMNVLRACHAAMSVTYVGPGPAEALQHAIPGISVQGLGRAPLVRTSWWRETLRAREPVTPARLVDLAPYRQALDLLDLSTFDLIWIERGHLAVLGNQHRARVIVDLDDIEHIRALRELRLQRGAHQAAKQGFKLANLLLRELVFVRGYRRCVVCSDEDAAYLRRCGLANVMVVPNGTELHDEVRLPAVREPHAVFVGNMMHAPNLDAVRYAQEQILPRIRRIRPDFRLDVIGNPPAEASAFGTSVRFLGFVDDLGNALARYAMLLAPLRFGSGTKLKVLDALGAGLPVVTTPVGAEGLSLTDATAVVSVDPDGLAEAVLRLLGDSAAASELGAAGRRHAQERFGWTRIRERLTDDLRRLVH